jgi:hypothetical protein
MFIERKGNLGLNGKACAFQNYFWGEFGHDVPFWQDNSILQESRSKHSPIHIPQITPKGTRLSTIHA